MTTIAIVAFDGVTDIDVFSHWDLLNRPLTACPEAGRHWSVRLLGTSPQHTTAAGLQLAMHGTIDEAGRADAVVISSGPVTRTLMLDEDYLERLALDPSRQLVTAQCSGSLILAACGVLRGLTATTYPTARAQLEDFGVPFVRKPLVAHQRVATAAGCRAGARLDYWLLERLVGADTARACVDSTEAWGDGLEQLYDFVEEAA